MAQSIKKRKLTSKKRAIKHTNEVISIDLGPMPRLNPQKMFCRHVPKCYQQNSHQNLHIQ